MWAPLNFPPWRVSYVDISTQSSHLGEDRWSHSHPLAEVVSVCLQTNSQAVYLWWQCDPTSVCTSYSADFSWVSVSEITKKYDDFGSNLSMLSISLQCSTLCLYFFSLLPAQTHSANIWTERSCVVCSNTFWFAWNFCYKKQKYRK